MVLYRRNLVPGGTFFFTLTLADRRSSVLTDHIRQTRDEHPFSIDAVVVLPEHLHAILTLPPEDSDYSGRWRRLKGLFTRGVVASGVSVPCDNRGEYTLWQKRFWEHTIRDDGDFERCADYIHFNPVKHRLVTRPGAWRFSSLHRYVRAGTLPGDWGGDDRAHDANFGERADGLG